MLERSKPRGPRLNEVEDVFLRRNDEPIGFRRYALFYGVFVARQEAEILDLRSFGFETSFIEINHIAVGKSISNARTASLLRAWEGDSASPPRPDACLLRVARFSSSKDEVARTQKQSRSHAIRDVAVDAVTAGGGVSRPEWRRRAQWPG